MEWLVFLTVVKYKIPCIFSLALSSAGMFVYPAKMK